MKLMDTPWNAGVLGLFAIAGMNHYHIEGQKRLFVCMVYKGRAIKHEGVEGCEFWGVLRSMAIEAIEIVSTLPTEPGVYRSYNPGSDTFEEIDVYPHPAKGLCTFENDVHHTNDSTDCHVPVQYGGYIFLERLRDLEK